MLQTDIENMYIPNALVQANDQRHYSLSRWTSFRKSAATSLGCSHRIFHPWIVVWHDIWSGRLWNYSGYCSTCLWLLWHRLRWCLAPWQYRSSTNFSNAAFCTRDICHPRASVAFARPQSDGTLRCVCPTGAKSFGPFSSYDADAFDEQFAAQHFPNYRVRHYSFYLYIYLLAIKPFDFQIFFVWEIIYSVFLKQDVHKRKMMSMVNKTLKQKWRRHYLWHLWRVVSILYDTCVHCLAVIGQQNVALTRYL